MTKPKQKILVPMSNERRVAAYTRDGHNLTAKQLRRIRKHEHRSQM
jgi:hypothetical protein